MSDPPQEQSRMQGRGTETVSSPTPGAVMHAGEGDTDGERPHPRDSHAQGET